MEPLTIREVTDSDWEAVANLRNIYLPQKTTGELQRRRNSEVDGENFQCRVAADDGGNLLGYCRTSYRSADPAGLFRISLFVDPSTTGRGVGRRLLSESEAFANENGAACLVGSVEAVCDRGMKFAREAGFEPIQHLFWSRLDLSGFNPAPFLEGVDRLRAQGYEFLTFAEFPDTDDRWDRLYSLDTAADPDAPGSENWGLGTRDEYRKRLQAAHGHSESGILLALYQGDWVGMHIVNASVTPGEVATDFTGVRREHRGKGLALALKTLGVQHAQSIGGRVLVTSNDERNAPMLAVNRKLGFVAEPGFYMMRKPLA